MTSLDAETVTASTLPPAFDICASFSHRVLSTVQEAREYSEIPPVFLATRPHALEHDGVRVLEDIARQGIIAIKEKDAAKGASLSNVAATVVLQVDADARRGQNVVRGSRLGHKTTHGTTGEKKARWGEWQAQVNKLCDERPGLSWTAITRHVAKRMGCNAKSIQRRCRDPRKNK